MKKLIISILFLIALSHCEKWDLNHTTIIKVTTGEISDISLNNATIEGEFQGLVSGSVSNHGFVYSNINNVPTIRDTIISLGLKEVNGRFLSRIENLEPNTSYYIRGFVEFDKKNHYGNVQSFLTGGIQVNTLSVKKTESTRALVIGQVTGLDSDLSITEHGHCWSSTIPLPTIEENCVKLGMRSLDGLFESIIFGLQGLDTFYIRSFVQLNGETIYGNTITYLRKGVWERINDLPDGGSRGSFSFAIGNKGYVGAGRNIDGQYLKSFWEYDPVLDQWEQKADYGGDSVIFATSFAIGNKGYAGLGTNDFINYKNDLWEYDPTEDSWIEKSDFIGENRAYAISFVISNKAYVGTGVGEEDFNDFYSYVPETDTWEAVSSFPGESRLGAFVFSINEMGYVGNGNNGEFGENFPTDYWVYDPLDNEWTYLAEFPGGGRALSFFFSIGGYGYVGGGSTIGTIDDFWRYDPDTETWTELESIGIGLTSPFSFVIDSSAYVGFRNNGIFFKYVSE